MSLVMNFVYQATAFVALMALDHRRQTADRLVWHTLMLIGHSDTGI